MSLVGEQEALGRQRAEKIREVERVERSVDHAQGRVDLVLGQLKKRLRVRSNLRLDERAWRRLIMSSTAPTEMIRRRGYLAAVLRYDLDLLRRLKSERIVLEALRGERIEAVSAVSALELELRGRRDRLEDARQVKSEVLRGVRKERRLLKRILDDRRDQRTALALGPSESGGDLVAEKGLLPRPVSQGRVRVGYGDHQDPLIKTRTFSNGWVLQAPMKTPVRAIHEGLIVFSGWYRGFGNLVIVDHGGDHYSLYGHLHTRSLGRGDRVKQGTMLGEVGETGSLRGPQLYFELRVQRRATDPAGWLLGGVR
jgi:murein DD-endopeptidase MepM/ murein hydrolase activator NlpD